VLTKKFGSGKMKEKKTILNAAKAIVFLIVFVVFAYIMVTKVLPGLEQTKEMTLSPVESSDPQAIRMHYEWEHGYNKYSWDVAIPRELHQYAENKPRITVRELADYSVNYSVYITDPRDDNLLKAMVASIDDLVAREGLGEEERLYMAITLAQNIPYGYDNETKGDNEYPRYPVEMLVDNVGDCEDHALLAGALLREMGYDVALFTYPKTSTHAAHIALGVAEGRSLTFYGTSYSKDGKKYYCLDPTGKGYKVGDPTYAGESAYVSPIVPVPILTHTWQSSWYGTTLTVTVTVKNEGSAAAEGVSVKAGFLDANDQLWNAQASESFDLESFSERTVILQLQRTTGKYVRLAVYVMYKGYAYDRSYSGWFST